MRTICAALPRPSRPMEHQAKVVIPEEILRADEIDALNQAEWTLMQELTAKGCTEFDAMRVRREVYRRRLRRSFGAKLLGKPRLYGGEHHRAVCTMTGH